MALSLEFIENLQRKSIKVKEPYKLYQGVVVGQDLKGYIRYTPRYKSLTSKKVQREPTITTTTYYAMIIDESKRVNTLLKDIITGKTAMCMVDRIETQQEEEIENFLKKWQE